MTLAHQTWPHGQSADTHGDGSKWTMATSKGTPGRVGECTCHEESILPGKCRLVLGLAVLSWLVVAGCWLHSNCWTTTARVLQPPRETVPSWPDAVQCHSSAACMYPTHLAGRAARFELCLRFFVYRVGKFIATHLILSSV